MAYASSAAPVTTASAAESTSDESETQDEAEPASNAQMREMDSIVSAMEADGAADPFVRTNGKRLNRIGNGVRQVMKARRKMKPPMQMREMDSIVRPMGQPIPSCGPTVRVVCDIKL